MNASKKFELIHKTISSDSCKISIKEMCKIAGVSRSGYYNYINSIEKKNIRELQDQSDFNLILEAGAALSGLKKIAGISFKALAVGATAAATAIGAIVTKATSAYAEYEQLIGGVQTLFKGSASIVEKNANNAFKTAGLSANQYMETVTSFSASLIQSLGGDTAKVAAYADMAIIDMSDNANKMGTDMSMIQNAYQGFAKQNYTMLDNLKLGYGGTKTEMARLVKDAAKLDKSVKANDMSFGNIVKAIHAVQVNMGIAGATTAEAEGTITGSLASVKASWNNLMPALIQGGDAFDQCLDNFVQSASTFGKNMLPTIEKALGGVGKLIEAFVPIIEKELPTIIDSLLPPLIKATVSLTAGLIKALPTIVKSIVKEIPKAVKILWDAVIDTFGTQFPILNKITDFFKKNSGAISGFFKKSGAAITKFLPILLGLFGAFKLIKGATAVMAIFGGGKSGKTGKSGGLFGGLTTQLKTLAKVKPTTILKGMRNLAIILGGIGLLTVAFMAVAPHISKLSDIKSIVKLAAVMLILGVLGTALAKFGGIVGKIPVATVAKGLANMAIMLAGMSLLFIVVGAVTLIPFDYKKILMLAGVITVLGVIGAALGILGGIVGVIPVATVALGLANMAIMLAGMSALLILINWVISSITFDVGKILILAGLITVLGTVGSVLSVFAGIVGMIPIPVVLSGLANMALVLGGVTALILAYGALSQIEGFNDFITKGGETLANVFNVIGKCVGSIIGGVGEGLTNSLPKIGENLAGFATSLSPMFEVIGGIDTEGLGNFFKAIGAFMLQMAGEKLLSFLTGGTDLTKVGEQLDGFSQSAQSAFNRFAEYPQKGIDNAPKILKSLDGIGKYDFKSGGLAQLFTGKLGLKNVGKELDGFSESAKTAFERFAEFPQKGVDNAPKILDSIDGIGKYDFKTGGLAQLFTGKVGLSNIGTELDGFASTAKNAFICFTEYPEKGITNAPRIFDAISAIGRYDFKTGGFAQLFTGEVGLANIGAQLDSFAQNGKNAFIAFSEYPEKGFENFNSAVECLKGLGDITKTAFDTSGLDDFSKGISALVEQVKDLPKQMGNGLRSASEELSTALVDIWKDAVKASVAPVNKLLSGANHILKEFGSNKRVIEWTPYARGTSGHKGGNALVNDGRGAELVQMPNGNTFIPKGRNVLIPNAPKGMKVLPAESTAQVMGKGSPTFSYADGTGDIDIWSYFDNASGLVSKISEGIKYSDMSGFVLNAGKGMVSTFAGAMAGWVEKLFEESGQSINDYVPSKGVTQWRATVARALKMEGQYSAANVARTLYQMQTESGGNPRAINLWDRNAKNGTPSKGLMQVIDPTFNAYARSGYNKNIYDPLSNILASIRYAVSRYGSLAKAYRGKGYANGGIATKASIFGEDGAEMAIPLSASKRKRGLELWAETGEIFGFSAYSPESDNGYHSTTYAESNTYAPHFELHISGTNDDRAMERKCKRWIAEAWADMLDTFDSKNPKTQEI